MIFSRNRRLTAGLTGAALLALALSGCTSPSTGSSAGGGPTLSIYDGASGAFTKNFNPLSPTVLNGVRGFVYEPLFFYNNAAPLGTKPQPLLGSAFSWNTEGTQLSVTIRKGVTWSDGKAFTAEDVAFTMNLLRSSPALNTTGNTPAAKATDADHVVLTFDKPSFENGPNILGRTWILPEHIWKGKKDPATDVNADAIGTGPLEVASFSAQTYLLKKNPRFRDAGKIAVGGTRFTSLSGNEAATNKILAGQIDWSNTFIPNVTKVIAKRPTVKNVFFGSQQIVLASCSNTDLGCTGPQTDPAVRQAMAAAVDRNQVNALAYYGNATSINPTFAIAKTEDQFIAAPYKSDEPMQPDVQKAESLLEADGWQKGSDGIYAKDGKRLSMSVIVTSGYTDYIAALQAITQQYKAAGIEIDVKQEANQEVNSAAALGRYQLQIAAIYQGPVADPFYVYDQYFRSTNTAKVGTSVNPYGNVARFADPAVDAALVTAAGTEDNAAKAAAYATIQKRIVDDMPYIPIINNRPNTLYSTTKVTGFPTEGDAYAQPVPGNAPDNEVVLMHLTTK